MNDQEQVSDRDRVLRWASEGSLPETCAAARVHRLLPDFGDRAGAEAAIEAAWQEGLIAPVGFVDTGDGLIDITPPTMGAPLGDQIGFTLTRTGYESVGRLHELTLSLDADFIPSEEAGQTVPERIVSASAFINEILWQELQRNPERMLNLPPREFEEFVAELFSREGFDVTLTPPSRDGGRDILAISNSDLGSHLYIAECKRFRPDRPVGVGYVRSLYGVVEKDRATKGILATTSQFTRGAKAEAQDLKWRIRLRDYEDLVRWISQVTTRPADG